MTSQAQQALRRIMEEYSSTTRFALACNYSTKIIEAIQSRCAILRYTKLSDPEVLMRLKQIAKEENVPYTDDGMEALLFTASGDMRQAINNLQSTNAGFVTVNAENVFKVPTRSSTFSPLPTFFFFRFVINHIQLFLRE
eukprot:TRINITY_DN506_c0_g1_i14.p1 TRINITY_DN506_c0_g1~~TRINITY_DN506_c0_g1_i14.p1  ORF type:complete len:139 (-),score=28.17 TRINITY_DN506_c0_g1_i14:432-848(-)